MIQCSNLHIINFSGLYFDSQRNDHWTCILGKRWMKVYSECLTLRSQELRIELFQLDYLKRQTIKGR
jgi:hypothetical protein